MRLATLLGKFGERGADACVVYQGQSYSYAELDGRRAEWVREIAAQGISAGQVVGLETDYSFDAIALFLALLSNANIVALVPTGATAGAGYLSDGQVEGLIRLSDEGWSYEPRSYRSTHPLISELRASRAGGFVIFSSGSTGRPKAVLHGIESFLKKFDAANKRYSTLTFLLFDHIAGIDTLFYGLASGGSLVLPKARDARSICTLIQNHRVEVLPTSPTFLRMLCLSGEYERFDLSSLEIVTYGSEPMDADTLQRVGRILPGVKLIQKYGMSELGSPQSRSRGDDSLWMRMDSPAFQTKIVDGILWIKAASAMMGYLNAPSPFDADGWLCTGDAVEVDGEWMRVLGRKSEIIIVGGEKVYPQEVEAVMLEMDNIEDVAVRGEPHPMIGQIVTARVNLREPRDEKTLLKEIRVFCRTRLPAYKVPVKVESVETPLTTSRQKKTRT